jgi:hypothetical protein
MEAWLNSYAQVDRNPYGCAVDKRTTLELIEQNAVPIK